MAQCPNCGEQIPRSAVFCPSCGARQAEQSAPIAYTPEIQREDAYAPYGQQSSFDAPVSSQPVGKKKNLKLIIILAAAVLVIGGVLLTLFLTGVLGGGPDVTGVWTLAEGPGSAYQPGDIVLNLSENGTGYAQIKGEYKTLTWDKKSITIDGNSAAMRLDGDDLILTDNGADLVFRREGAQSDAAPAASGGLFGAGGSSATPAPADVAPATEQPAATAEPPATEQPAPTPAPALSSGPSLANPAEQGVYPVFAFGSGQEFPFGPWTGVYLYNGNYFRTYFEINPDYTCRRVIYRNGEVVKDEKGIFEYSGSEIRLYMNGETNTYTGYKITGQMMVNNNHEFYRQDPGGLIGSWIGDYMYNGKHIHTTIILRSDFTYSEVTYIDDDLYRDEEGSWTLENNDSLLRLKGNDTPEYTTPYDIVNGTLINNNFVYVRG